MWTQLHLDGIEPMPTGYVYFGARGSFIKIGYSKQPMRRCRQLGLKPVLMISGSLSDEKALHGRFKRSRTDREWFISSPEIASFIADNANTSIDMLRRAA